MCFLSTRPGPLDEKEKFFFCQLAVSMLTQFGRPSKSSVW